MTDQPSASEEWERSQATETVLLDPEAVAMLTEIDRTERDAA